MILRVHLAEDEEGAVVAMRPIAEVERFADRITAEPGRLGVLYRHGAALGASTDLDTVLSVTAELVFELLPQATHLAVALKERAGRFPVVYASRRDGDPTDIPVSRTLIKRVLEARAGVLLTNAASEMSSARSVVQAGLASTLTVPLWTGADIRGVLHVDNRDATGVFAADDLEVLTVAAGHISFAAENARLVARLRLAEQRLERENRYLKEREQEEKFPGIIGQSRGIAQVLEAVGKVRDTRVPVLIQGETGTGKELVARALHYTSQRADHLFVAQNCSALPENLLESELFGHTRGAFTGADRDKKGLFELADRGTIFLDEIAEMPVQLQAKLLRVLQEGEIWPLGAPRPKRVDVRVVSATHQDLEAMVKAGTFRQDLFYRLHVLTTRLPPLRDRPGDLRLLVEHLLGQVDGAPPRVGEAAWRCLERYAWPGNVRELRAEVERWTVAAAGEPEVGPEHLSPAVREAGGYAGSGGAEAAAAAAGEASLAEAVEALERAIIARGLERTGRNRTQLAKELGISRTTLNERLKRFGMG